MSKKSVSDMKKMFENDQNFRPMRRADMRAAPPPPSSKLSSRAAPSLTTSKPIENKREPGLSEENESLKLNFIKKPRQPNKAKPSSLQFLNNRSEFERMDSFESKENEQVTLLTDKTNINGSTEVDDFEKRKQHAMQLDQILKPELLIDRKLFPESRGLEKREAITLSTQHVDLVQQSDNSSVEELREEVRSLRNELDETRSELARVQINFNSFEIDSRQAFQKQNIEIEKLRKKLIFIMKKGFLAQMDGNSTFIGNTNSYEASKSAAVDGAGGHVSRPRTRKTANHDNDSSVDDAEDIMNFNKRKSTEFEEDGVIKF